MNTKKSYIIEAIVFIVIAAGFLGWGIFNLVIDYNNQQNIEITVEEKIVKDGRCFIIDTNDTVYVVKDLLFAWKWNSEDIFARLEEGGVYKVRTSGTKMRFPFIKNFPNINEIEEIISEPAS